MVTLGLVKGVAVYGHWVGDVHSNSMFYAKSGAGFVQHGWVVLENGNICDPTRWVFEGRDPYIFCGPNNGEYDEGGNKHRMRQRGRTTPRYSSEERQYNITKDVMDSKTWSWVEKYLDIDYAGADEQEPGVLCAGQIWFLAHTDPAELGQHAGAIFDAIVKLGREALIPIDNLRMVERARKGKKT